MSHGTVRSRLLVDLAKGFALADFYPLTHPTMVQAVLGLESGLLSAGEFLRLSVGSGGIVLGEGEVAPRSGHIQRLGERLDQHGVRVLILRHDVGSESLGLLLSALALPARVVRAGGGFAAALSAAGAARVAVNGSWVHPSRDPAPGADDAEPGRAAGPDLGITLWSAHDMYEQVRESAVRVEQESVIELRHRLREGEESERLEVLSRLEFLAQHYLQRGEMDRALSLMDDLRRDAEELRARNPAVRAHAMLAIHRLATRPVIDELVTRLGQARSEEERGALRSILLHIGADTVTPLVRALTAATELGARRSYRDALVALDQAGVPLLEDMLGDERWFVVRNMVGILGEVRSADAIDHLARTISHSDVRVRRETIVALSKVGGEESVPLLGRGLSDGEAKLRAAAALGLGLTKLAIAVAPLLARLREETDAEVVEEIVRALGRLGDPSAVPAIAERAAAGGWLSRTPTSIRVEAVRALRELGGETAREVLNGLLRDRNSEVREAAFQALS